jgi:hypothetical protein
MLGQAAESDEELPTQEDGGDMAPRSPNALPTRSHPCARPLGARVSADHPHGSSDSIPRSPAQERAPNNQVSNINFYSAH